MKPRQWHGGKGDYSRVSDFEAYQSSPLWENMKNKKYDSYTEFSNDFTPIIEEVVADTYKPKRFLFLDDCREVRYAQIYDLDKSLTEVSGIDHTKWDIVRTYDEFVEYIETYGIPQVVSFDNDLWEPLSDKISEEDTRKMFQMIDWENSPIKTGAHCAKWLAELCQRLKLGIPKYYIHSANPIGRAIIKEILENKNEL